MTARVSDPNAPVVGSDPEQAEVEQEDVHVRRHDPPPLRRLGELGHHPASGQARLQLLDPVGHTGGVGLAVEDVAVHEVHEGGVRQLPVGVLELRRGGEPGGTRRSARRR